jgi:hypothetical protein
MTVPTKTPKTIRRLGEPLNESRAALKGVVRDLDAGGHDLYGDFKTLVRSARSDTTKLGKALHRDVERLAKAPGARSAPPRRRAHPRKTPA